MVVNELAADHAGGEQEASELDIAQHIPSALECRRRSGKLALAASKTDRPSSRQRNEWRGREE